MSQHEFIWYCKRHGLCSALIKMLIDTSYIYVLQLGRMCMLRNICHWGTISQYFFFCRKMDVLKSCRLNWVWIRLLYTVRWEKLTNQFEVADNFIFFWCLSGCRITDHWFLNMGMCWVAWIIYGMCMDSQ